MNCSTSSYCELIYCFTFIQFWILPGVLVQEEKNAGTLKFNFKSWKCWQCGPKIIILIIELSISCKYRIYLKHASCYFNSWILTFIVHFCKYDMCFPSFFAFHCSFSKAKITKYLIDCEKSSIHWLINIFIIDFALTY